jgi:hypothetical protein
MRIELIRGTLAATENSGLETTDPRFSDLATLVQEGHYKEAARGAEELLGEKIYDIRVIGYFLYGHFIDGGISALAEIYRLLTELLADNFEAVGPVKNRVRHLQTMLNWLTRQIIKQLEYHEEKKSDLYREWAAEVSVEQIRQALDAGDDLRSLVDSLMEKAAAPVHDGLSKIHDWLWNFQGLVHHDAETAEPTNDEGQDRELKASTEEEESQAAAEIDELRANRKSERSPSTEEAEQGTAGVEGSYPLQVLIEKLQAFDTLIADRKYLNASIVADDINAIIANFDPRIYFPRLFRNFAMKSATNINNLMTYAEYKETPAWQALQELYKVDLQSFIDFNLETTVVGGSDASNGYGGHDE